MIRDRRRQIIDYSIIGIVLLVIAVLFWPSFGGNGEADPAPDEIAEEIATPTAEPEPDETPTPEPTPEPTPVEAEEYPSLCVPGDATQVLANFIQRFNDGDLEGLAEMLPSRGSESPRTSVYPGMDQQILHSFRLHESRLMSRRYEVIDYLADRMRVGERWRLKEYSLSRMYRVPAMANPELDEARAVIQRSAEDMPTHEMQGHAVINCVEGLIVLWDFATDDPDLAVPILVDDFLGAVGPYGVAETRNVRMIVSTDLRPDWGGLREWDIRRNEANSVAGHYVERIVVSTMGGDPVVAYIFDGERWYLNQRGWEASGEYAGSSILPLEIMLTRREPSITANVIRDHPDQIPFEGMYTITGGFDLSDEMLQAVSHVDGAGAVEGIIEVEIEDGALVRTRYRLIGESGLHFTAPEIRWIEIERSDRYDVTLFHLPQGHLSIGPQYEIPEGLAEQIALIEESDPLEGIAEVYRLTWRDVAINVWVMPSRGGLYQNARGDGWDPVWRAARTVFDELQVSVAEIDDRIYPSHAVWDTGRYRFELWLDSVDVSDSDVWNMNELRAVVEALTYPAPDTEN